MLLPIPPLKPPETRGLPLRPIEVPRSLEPKPLCGVPKFSIVSILSPEAPTLSFIFFVAPICPLGVPTLCGEENDDNRTEDLAGEGARQEEFGFCELITLLFLLLR